MLNFMDEGWVVFLLSSLQICPLHENKDYRAPNYYWILFTEFLVIVCFYFFLEGRRQRLAQYRDTIVEIAWEVFIFGHFHHDIQQGLETMAAPWVYGSETARIRVVFVSVNLQRDMGNHTKISRTPTQHGIKQIRVPDLAALNPTRFTVGGNNAEFYDVIRKEPETSAQLTVSSSMEMSTHMDVLALTVWHKSFLSSKAFIELVQREADTERH